MPDIGGRNALAWQYTGMTPLLRTSSVRLAAVAAVVAAAASLVALLALPAAASATYRGRAGALVYQDHYSFEDLAYGDGSADNWYLTEAGKGRVFSCEAAGSGSPGNEFCADNGVGFAPNGGALVFAGAELNADGSATPGAWVGCGTWCPQELFVGDLGGDVRPVHVPIADAEHPAFMPDGTTLVFAGRTSAHARTHLYLVNRDGTGLSRITTSDGTNPAPCADSKIVYNRGSWLYVIRANRRSSRRLTRGSLADCSRDSRTVVFLRSSTLYTINLNGRHLRRLSPPGAAVGRPSFSPAGGQIAYIAGDVCTTQGCRGGGCRDTSYELTVITLTDAVVSRREIGTNGCSTDGDDGSDSFGQVAWQPLPT